MQDHHALNFGSSFAVQLVYRFDKNGVLTDTMVQEFVSIKPASLAVSSSFTYNSLWKHKMSRRMKMFATTNAIHTT